MNAKQFEISTHSRYSWTNLHEHNFVPCRKCCAPMTPTEFGSAIDDLGKIVAARLPERCSDCEMRKRLKKEEKAREAKEEKEIAE